MALYRRPFCPLPARAVALALLLCLVVGACAETPPVALNPSRTPGPRTATPASEPPPLITSTPIRDCVDSSVEGLGDCDLAATFAAHPGRISWFIGLGGGTDSDDALVAQEVAYGFHEQNEHDLRLAPSFISPGEAYEVLHDDIATGSPPDIIGPAGRRAIETFKEQLLPLDDLLARHGVDLSAYDEAALRPYRNAQGQLIALPYALFPSFLYFNKDLFDAAQLPYPPQKVGAQYQGKAWNMDTLRELGMRLTLDAQGRNAAEPGFDPARIVQYGFVPQWVDSALSEGAFFGAGDLTGPNDEATFSPAWQAAWRWFYRARHVDHFVPDAAARDSEAFGKGNVWSSGRVAMAWAHLWYTCCFTAEQVPRWDLAVVPSYNGTTTAKLHADTFAILKATKNPEGAFEAYLYLLTNQQLRQIYGGLSPIKAEQPGYFKALDQTFAPNRVTWQVALDSLAYADLPSHEQPLPNQPKAEERLGAFDQRRHAAANLDIDAEIKRLESDLTAIFRE